MRKLLFISLILLAGCGAKVPVAPPKAPTVVSIPFGKASSIKVTVQPDANAREYRLSISGSLPK